MMRAGAAMLPFDLPSQSGIEEELNRFQWQGAPTERGYAALSVSDSEAGVPTLTNEFWTAKQRAPHSLHEVSCRACFKPQLPEFFISRLTAPGDVVYDPFMGEARR
jgi:hypothetical protein